MSRMPAVAVLFHIDPPQAGHLARALQKAGVELRGHMVGAASPLPDLDTVDGVVSLGGHGSVVDIGERPELLAERVLLLDAVRRGMPVLGICLGGQLLASAVGGRVLHTGGRQIGWGTPELLPAGMSDPLLAGTGGRPTMHWNEDAIELPEGAVELQHRTGAGVEAFRVGDCAWGLQYHPEMDPAMLDALYRSSAEHLEQAGVTEDAARRLDLYHADRQRAEAEVMFGRFASLVMERSARALDAVC